MFLFNDWISIPRLSEIDFLSYLNTLSEDDHAKEKAELEKESDEEHEKSKSLEEQLETLRENEAALKEAHEIAMKYKEEELEKKRIEEIKKLEKEHQQEKKNLEEKHQQEKEKMSEIFASSRQKVEGELKKRTNIWKKLRKQNPKLDKFLSSKSI